MLGTLKDSRDASILQVMDRKVQLSWGGGGLVGERKKGMRVGSLRFSWYSFFVFLQECI